MLSNKKYFIALFIINSGILNSALSQTSDWKVIWDRNPLTDNVAHYLLYRETGSPPNINSTIVAQLEEPSSQSQDTVMYVDGDIEPGIQYFYAVQAVNVDQLSSIQSNSVSAAIPRILFAETLLLKSDSTYQISLNHSSYVNDPDHNSSDLIWNLSGSNQIEGSINSSNNILTINTPVDTTITETFQFTVTDPDEFFDQKSVTITLTAETPGPPPPPPPDGTDDVEKVVAYPIPYVGSDPPPCDCINFQFHTSISAKTLSIYTIMGDLVYSESDLTSSYDWKVINSSGKKISPGLYLYFVQDDKGAQVASGKIVVIR